MNLKATKKTNNDRKYVGGGPRPDLRNLRKTEAAERLVEWQSLTNKEQLAELDRRLGAGIGAKKQRARIKALIESPPKQVSKKERGEKSKR